MPRPDPKETVEFDQIHATALDELRDADSFFLVWFPKDDPTMTKIIRCVKREDLRKLAVALNDTLSETIDAMNPIQVFMFVTQLREDMGL